MKLNKAILLIGFALVIITAVILLSTQTNEKTVDEQNDNDSSTNGRIIDPSSSSNQNGEANSNKVKTVDTDSSNSIPHSFSPPRFVQDITQLQNNPNNPSELPKLAAQLDDLTISEAIAVEHLDSLLEHFRLATDGFLPGADNIDITNGLLGDNLKKIAFISSSSSRINSDGELTDKWGTAYDFHLISMKDARIRSAGADKKFYTEDDITSPDKPTNTRL